MSENMSETLGVSIPMPNIIMFFVAFFAFTILYLKSRNKYGSLIEPLDKKDFPLKSFMSMGCQVMDIIKYKYDTSFDRTMRKKLIELYDKEYCEYYLRMNYAAAATSAVIGIFLIGILSLALQISEAFLMGTLIGFLLAYIVKNNIDKKYEKRHLLISMELPDVANKLVILLGAGLTLRAAWEKVSTEMANDSPLYDEMKLVVKQMENGVSDADAFDNMSLRCNIPQMRRFISVIIQNIHRGGSDISNALTLIGQELWENRKALTKRLAEEASTKLLFPMMLMLITVILIVVSVTILGLDI